MRQSGVFPQKGKAPQAIIGLFESTAAAGEPTADGGAGIWSLVSTNTLRKEEDKMSVHLAACSQPSFSESLSPRPQSQPIESHILWQSFLPLCNLLVLLMSRL